MPELPQSIQAASKIKEFKNSIFQCQSASRHRQLPRSNPYENPCFHYRSSRSPSAFGVHFGAWSAPGRRNPENLRTAWRDPHIKSFIKNAWFHYGGRRFRPGGLVGAFGVHLGAWSAPGRRSPENLRTAWRDPHIKSLGPKAAPKQPLSMPGLPQSIQVASKIKSLFENNSFQCQNSPSRSRQLPRSKHYQIIAVFTARAPAVDPGSFQDQILI